MTISSYWRKIRILYFFSHIPANALRFPPVQQFFSHYILTHTFFFSALPVFPNKWPSGDYGLPKPTSGCPDKNWREGFRYQDSENVQNTNLISNGSHLSGRVNQHGVRQEFCMHHDTPAGESIPWPRGKYCIYKKEGKCPLGLSEGTLKMINWEYQQGLFSIWYCSLYFLIQND